MSDSTTGTSTETDHLDTRSVIRFLSYAVHKVSLPAQAPPKKDIDGSDQFAIINHLSTMLSISLDIDVAVTGYNSVDGLAATIVVSSRSDQLAGSSPQAASATNLTPVPTDPFQILSIIPRKVTPAWVRRPK